MLPNTFQNRSLCLLFCASYSVPLISAARLSGHYGPNVGSFADRASWRARQTLSSKCYTHRLLVRQTRTGTSPHLYLSCHSSECSSRNWARPPSCPPEFSSSRESCSQGSLREDSVLTTRSILFQQPMRVVISSYSSSRADRRLISFDNYSIQGRKILLSKIPCSSMADFMALSRVMWKLSFLQYPSFILYYLKT
jgi:hypothetical protein